MKSTKLLLLIIFLVSSQMMSSQDKHITYIVDEFSIDLNAAANKKPSDTTTITTKTKGHQHILVFEDKKAISFKNLLTYSSSDSMIYNNYKRYYPTLFDKKKESSKHLSLLHNYATGKIYINSSSTMWNKITPLEEPTLIKQEKSFIYSYYKDSLDLSFHPPEIVYTDNSKTIKGYLCKNAIVTKGERTYDVWYTEELDYNWCFADYNYLIPGTPIIIYYNNETFIEFVSIEDFNEDTMPVDKDVVDFVLKNWNKKIK